MSPPITLSTAMDRLTEVALTNPLQTLAVWAALAVAGGYAVGRRFRYKVGWVPAVFLTLFGPVAVFNVYYFSFDLPTTDPFGVAYYVVFMLLVYGSLAVTPATIIGWVIGRDRRSAA